MARTREFEPQETLNKAMHLFWNKGYSQTSVRDLVKHTGVAHAGLYEAFGGKRELYQSCLQNYNLTIGNYLIGPLEQAEASYIDIEQFFIKILDAIRDNQFTNGCLICNTAIEFGSEDDDILELAKHNIERMTAGFRNALDRASELNQINRELDLDVVASFLTTAFHGIAVMARAKIPLKKIEDSINMTLRVLD